MRDLFLLIILLPACSSTPAATAIALDGEVGDASVETATPDGIDGGDAGDASDGNLNPCEAESGTSIGGVCLMTALKHFGMHCPYSFDSIPGCGSVNQTCCVPPPGGVSGKECIKHGGTCQPWKGGEDCPAGTSETSEVNDCNDPAHYQCCLPMKDGG
ncbi:MAG: hypothetical protein NVS3B20_11560 [Polyangiales bacterium]